MDSITHSQRTITIGYGPGYAGNKIWNSLRSTLIIPTEIDSAITALRFNPALLLLDQHLIQEQELSTWRAQFAHALLLCTETMDLDADLILSDNLPYKQTCKLLEMACHHWVAKSVDSTRTQQQETSFRYLKKLADISIALSSEDDLMKLLRRILEEGQNIACCDAASLFLIHEVNDGKRELVFKLTQNDSMDFPFEEMHFPLDETSIVGYVASTDTELIIPDAYAVPAQMPYQFNRSFDRQTGYRTRSIFAIPLADKNNEVIGVLQFINRKKARSLKVTDEASALAHTLPFDSEINILLQALESQAGIAIENTILHSDIKALFEGFVNASVAAIEQRDPTTSGHSFRVADFCVNLAQAISRSNVSHLKHIKFSESEIRELKYAALLHDFGKVGVRESVLVKEKKLSPGNLDNIYLRILLAQERLCSQALNTQLAIYREGGRPSVSELQSIELQLNDDIRRLNAFYDAIKAANEPSITKQENREILDRINRYREQQHERNLAIITAEEFELLSIPKGSLSALERTEIESHVVHTQNFLNHIPWTKELQNVPRIAGAHHEKLDGSGYPHGISGDQIPLPSKIMTICDIYDALTASDRPYKPAMQRDWALDILREEAQRNLLDTDLVQVFIEARVFASIDSSHYGSPDGLPGISNHPCHPTSHDHSDQIH
jgi:HD-GYP domain-containing protein (c-di-GMP phosphodiesterase class II)